MENLTPDENLRADFFVTGNEYIRDNLNLKFIPRANSHANNIRGVILADESQDLQQSFLVAKNVFERVKPGKIKFVLIGLSPNKLSADEEKILGDYFKLCLDNGAKPVCIVLPMHSTVKKTYSDNDLKTFSNTINMLVKEKNAIFVDLLKDKLSKECFQDKTHLNEEGKAAVSALLSSKLYFKNILSPMDVCDTYKDFFDILAKYFKEYYQKLVCHIFCTIACDDFNRLSETLTKETCMDLMVQVFSKLTYSYLASLASIFPKDDYNDLMARIFKMSAEKIRLKDKIKVGFVLYDSSTWCGDDLYNFFAQDERFEPTVFLCMRVDSYKKNRFIQKEFLHQKEQFKLSALNIVTLDSEDSAVDEQDLIFYLIPYEQRLSKAFQLINIDVKTLLMFIPYSFEVGGTYDAAFTSIVRVAWKQFFPSQLTLEIYNRKIKSGTPQRVYSGYPKLDVFFKKNAEFKFNWKMMRPNAKKIIWAPHHSIKNWSIQSATFQWNYQFMYEFAKAHPEISWIVKPHSNLPVNAVASKVFPSVAAYEKYLKKWDELPNAKVYTGAYYNAIFATSDGIIHDCGSFTIEYQYVNKPMIYLTRDTQKFNKLGESVLTAAYLVDGQDLDAIAAMIQRVIIDGDDYKAAERKEVFDKYLNYPKTNGMLASEFIYKNIVDELKLPPR